ncbi:hypothetical protein SUGI_0690540 [Cryptomeria japonica]|nr:hypothetical protein SUGI_0690540 [Cryptomeria japonica]
MENTDFSALKIEDAPSCGLQRYGSLEQQSPVQKPLTQQQRDRMQLNKKMAMARQKTRRQSHEIPIASQEELPVEHSVPFWQPDIDIDILRNHSDDSYCEGCSKPISLSKQQVRVLRAIVKGQSVFVTGSAGTASTGIAACHLGGMTLHSFVGAIPGDTSKIELLARIKRSRNTVKRWKKAKALIIDEISMIDGEFFDHLNYVANELRDPVVGATKRVWGGLQLVVTGDFFQLPPVRPPNPNKYFAFQADCWDECFDKQIELKHVFRQSERDLIDMLQEIRKGLQNPLTLAKLNHCHGPPVAEDGSVVRLYPRNEDVRRENEEKLKLLGQSIVTFTALDTGKEQAKKLLQSGICPDQIGLCLGAQVMLIKNIETEKKLVNGATGEIVDFVEDGYPKEISATGLWPKVKFQCGQERIIGPEVWSIMEGDKEVAARTQVPLILAWALSVHKCQGMTLDRVETDLRRAFDYGMVYVALSRVKSLDGLRLIGFNPSKIKAHPKISDEGNG